MTAPLRKVYARLCRELAQIERSAVVHTRREARRLGDVPPAHALRAVGAHATALRPRLDSLMRNRQAMSLIGFARMVGQAFSVMRTVLFDRLIDAERSYRGTLLGFHHGVGVVRLLRDVAERGGDAHLVSFCDDWLAERRPLIEAAENQLHWFAMLPAQGVRSGLRLIEHR